MDRPFASLGARLAEPYWLLSTVYCLLYDVAMMNVPPPPPSAANPLRGAQLSFVGVGVMAEAVIAGLLRRQLVTRAQIVGSHPRPARRDELQNQYGVRMVESNAEAVRLADPAAPGFVVVAVKPQRVGRVLLEVKET